MKRFLGVLVAFACMLVHSAFACSTCNDMGYIQSHTTCIACNGRGKVANEKTTTCRACFGSGKRTHGKRDGGRFQGTFCRACGGTGTYNDKNLMACGTCGGSGTKVSRVICPTCKGASALNSTGGTEASGPVSGGTVPVAGTMTVGACTQCNEKGKVSKKIVCDVCDNGWNHRKNDSGTYVCRKCNAVCEARFIACKCGVPDCPKCKGGDAKEAFEVCPLCGGDKIITPLEREKAKNGEVKK